MIMLVEDDDNLAELCAYALKNAGYETELYDDGIKFEQALISRTPDLVILDIMLPGRDGLSILREMKGRQSTAKIPVIILTAKNGEADRIRGLDLGADDYITKPFSVLEMTLRVKAILRRCGESHGASLTAGGIEIDPERRRVTANGQQAALTYKEFELLKYLITNAGIVLSRDRIMEAVWGLDYGGETRTVDMHIKTLRQKLGSGGGCIKTVRNVGYRIED